VPALGGDQTSGRLPVSLVCCGLIGTMVDDRGMVDRAYGEAIATQGIVPGTTAYARYMTQVHQARGHSAAEVLRTMFPDSQARAQAAHVVLERSFCDAIDRTGVMPVPGAEGAVRALAAVGTRMCLITGFSRRVLTAVLDTLGWSDRVDLALCAEDVPRGSPWPDVVLSAMLRLGVSDVRETAVAHHAESGILSGRRAGAGLVAGVLTGVHSENRLRRAGATHLIPTIAHLPELLQASAGPAPDAPAAGAGPTPGVPLESRSRATTDG
jgi:phosphonatase-like hydrolase